MSAVYRRLHRDNGGKLPVVVCWDLEPDLRVLERGVAGGWAGFEELLPRIDALRARLAKLTLAPASFSWFLRMDPQVAEIWGSPGWVAERYAMTLAELEAHGDELGLHTHTWRWDARSPIYAPTTARSAPGITSAGTWSTSRACQASGL